MQPHFITVKEFSKLTGMPPGTVCYHCDKGLLPYSVIAYGKKKLTRMIDYQGYLRLMEQRKKPVIPQRIDRRPARARLLEMIAGVKGGHCQAKNNKELRAL